jgi:hypothetical protein
MASKTYSFAESGVDIGEMKPAKNERAMMRTEVQTCRRSRREVKSIRAHTPRCAHPYHFHQLPGLYILIRSSAEGPPSFLSASILNLPFSSDLPCGRGGINVQMRSVTSDLVSQTLRSNDGDLIADALVDLEVEAELGVVSIRSH